MKSFRRLNLHLFMIFLLSNLSLYVGSKYVPVLAPSYVVAFSVVIAIFIYGIERRGYLPEDRRILEVVVAGIAIILLFYFIAIFNMHNEHMEETIYERNRIIFYVAIAVLVFSLRTVSDVIMALKYVFALSLIGVSLNVVDFIVSDPEFLSYTPGRAAGLYKNPNIAGRVLIMSAVLSLFVVPKKYWLRYFTVIALGVFLTLSRGAIAVFLLTIGLLFYLRVFRIPRMSTTQYVRLGVKVGVFVVLVSAFLSSSYFQSWYDEVSEQTNVIEGRLQQLSGEDTESIKQDGRLELLKLHFKEYLKNPILGSGLGFSQSFVYEGIKAGSHNQLVYNLNEYGLLGAWLLGFYLCALGGRRGCRAIIDGDLAKRKPIVFVIFAILLAYIFFTHSYMSLYPDAILFVIAYKVGIHYRELTNQCVGFRELSGRVRRLRRRRRLVAS